MSKDGRVVVDYDNAPLPEPVYPCASPGCAREVSWPAKDISWSRGDPDEEYAPKPGWYCVNCLSMCDERMSYGPSLAKELRRRGLSR